MENSAKAKRLTAAEWHQIVDLYERGQGPMMRIAERFGVSRQAISVGLKKRGAVKDCRLDEYMVPFIVELDRQVIRRLRAQIARENELSAEDQRQMAVMDKLMIKIFADSGNPDGVAAVAQAIAERKVA